MPKNRQPGIHLHKTEPKQAIKRHVNGATYGPPVKPEYYWILIARNGKTIARSSETYKRKRSAVRSINIAARLFYDAEMGVGWNYFDHTAGKVKEDFIEF